MALSAAYFAYASAVRALVQTDEAVPAYRNPEQNPQAVAFAPVADETARIAREFLSDHEWAADADLRFRNDPEDREAGPRMFYYTCDAQQTDDDHSLRFRPLAMVWFQRQDREPLAIVADEAVITFQSSIEPTSLDPGRVISGQLIGAVSITGPDGLAIKGNHFVFSEKSAKIHSSNPVEFAWKRHHGRAEQIQIDLDVDDSPLAGTPLAVSSIREVHLIHDVQMEFAVPQGGDAKRVGRIEQPVPDGSPQQILTVNADGSFRLQFTGRGDAMMDQAIAAFEKDVTARMETSPGRFDEISGERIDLLLERQTADPASPQFPRVAAAGGESSLVPRRFRVTRSKEAPVWLRSDDNDLEAQMTTLDYDIVARRVLLNDADPRSAQSDASGKLPRVRLSFDRRRTELECAQVELHHDAEHHLKDVFCRGAGWLISREEAGVSADVAAAGGVQAGQGGTTRLQTALQVEWQKQLRRYFDPKSGLDVIDVAGDAVVRIPQERSGATADYIKVWVDPLESLAGDRKRSQGTSSEGDPVKGSQAKSQPVPRRILALDRVTFVSPELQGNMEELQVWFEDAPARSPESKRGLQPVSLRLDDRSGGGQKIELTSGAEPSPLPGTPGNELKEPVEISSRLTRVRMVRYADEKTPDVAEVLCEDRVEVRHRRSRDESPVVLTGDQLHIDNRGATDQRMHLLGRPARIDDPQMKLEGAELYFSRGDNEAWVNGAGTMRLAVDKDFEGRPLPTPEDLTVTWSEQMVFDGLVAQFNGRINATLQDSSMRCRQMDVTLTERISFGEAADGASKLSPSKSPQTAIAKIDCSGLVEFDSHVVEDGALVEVRRARVAEFSVNNQTNDVRALGPGTLTVWKRGQGNRASLGPVSMVAANRGLSAQQSKWEYSRIDFTRDMTGRIDQKSLLLQGQVQVVYGPVPAPLDVISVDSLPKDAGIMSCGELRVTQEAVQQGSPYVTLVASQNARLEGQSFFAQADEISYDESKGLYVLRSKGRDSILTREKQRGGKRAVAAARSLRFTPSQNKVEVDSASHIQGIQ
ncbi:hypothetical protein GC176_24875 [bacterium]|nr:hypothetical protein [bacterium]